MSYDLKIVNNNLAINPDGTIQTVRDNAKLVQDVIKIVLTPLGSNKFFQWYGCTIGSRTIGVVANFDTIAVEVERSIEDALSNLISLQKEQSKQQYVSPAETIAAIQDIQVLRSPSEPRLYQVVISLLTRQLTIVEETFTLTI